MSSQINGNSNFDILNSEDITVNLAANITLNILKSNDEHCDEIFNLWSEKLLKKFGLLECTCDVLEPIFSEFYNFLKKVFNFNNDEELTITNVQYKLMANCLADWIKIFDWLIESTENLKLHNLSIFIQYALKTLDLYLNLINESPLESENATQSQWQSMIGKSNVLHKMISNSIKTNINLFTGEDESCADLIRKILNLLSIHLKYYDEEILQIDLLKLINSVLSNNFDIFKKYPEEEEIWFRNFIMYLSKNIKNKIEMLYGQVFSKELDVTLKFTAFYLKCIKNVFDYEIYVCEDLMKIYYLLFTPPTTTVNTNTQDLVEQYLKVEALCILEQIYKNEYFLNLFFKDLIKQNKITSGFMLLSIEILRLLSEEENDCEVVATYFNKDFLAIIFSNIPQNVDVFICKSKFNELINYSCVLFTSYGSNEKIKQYFFNTLTNGILQDNLILATACIDIWILLGRLSNPDIRYEHYIFWSQLNNKLPKFSNKPSTIYMEQQLKLIYDILPMNYKENIWREFFTNIDKNKRLLLTLGIERITDVNKKNLMKNQLQQEICDFSNFKTVQNYYNILENLLLISKLHVTNSKLIKIIVNFWQIFFNINDLFNSNELFRKILIEFSINNFTYFNATEFNILINIIEKFLSNINNESDSITLYLIKFLEKAEHIGSIKNCLNLLENNKNILIRNNILILKNKTIKINYNEQNIIAYVNKLPITGYEHKCIRKPNEDYTNEDISSEIPAKKIKLNENFVNEKELIKKSLENANALKELYTSQPISTSSYFEIKKITNIYADILANKT